MRKIMKLICTAFILPFVFFVVACVPSLHPFYTESDLASDPALIGTWVEKETGETWSFSNRKTLEYGVVHIDSEGRRSEYDGRLVKIQGETFLDIVPAKTRATQNDSYRGLFLSTHTFVRVVSKQSMVEISYMEPRWLKDFLAQSPDAIRHEKINGEILITSSPKETQKFVLAHLNTRGAFSVPSELVRKRGGL